MPTADENERAKSIAAAALEHQINDNIFQDGLISKKMHDAAAAELEKATDERERRN